MTRLMRSGFVPINAIAGDPSMAVCARCGTGLDLRWVHVASASAWCGGCLADPDRDGTGERMIQWLTTPDAQVLFLADVPDEEVA